MAFSLFDHPSYKALLNDPDIDALFSPRAELRAMMLFEGALAQAQAKHGIIPRDAAEAIEWAARDIQIDPSELAQGTARDGLLVPQFVAVFRDRINDPKHAQYLHWGATSQDVADTGLILRLKRFLELLGSRMDAISVALTDTAAEFKNTPMAARTRGQVATATTFGAKSAVWCEMFVRHMSRLEEVKKRLLVVSCAGASGTSAVMGERAPFVMRDLAQSLSLGVSDVPWHATRDTIWELASLLGGISGSLGKVGTDLLQLGQSEIREVLSGVGGSSSTMPHKSNPVEAEALVALAHYAGGQVSCLHPAMLHAQDRDGSAWMLEWLTLPSLCAATGSSLKIGLDLTRNLTPNPDNMLRTIEATRGFMFAEASTFALAETMPRPEAQALVKSACKSALEQGQDLRTALEVLEIQGVDWDEVFSLENAVGLAPMIATYRSARS